MEPKPASLAIQPQIRPVRPHDRIAMAQFVERLDPDSRRQRFHGGVARCSESLAQQLCRADGARHQAWVAVLGAQDCEQIVGEARIAVDADGSAELAIAVAAAWQGRGVAQQLLRRALHGAAAAGAHRLVGEVLADNLRMQAFMSRNGFVVDPFAAGATLSMQRHVAPAQATARTAWQSLRARLAPRWLQPVLG